MYSLGKFSLEKYNLENDLKAKFVALVENLPDPPCQRLSVGLMKMVFKYRMIVSFL